MQIRRVTLDNQPAAVRLLLRFFVEEGFSTCRDDVKRNFDLLVADPSCWVALALRDGEAIGVVTVTTMLYVEWGRLGEIGDLYVLPEYRACGVGRRLVSEATDWCRKMGCAAASVVVTSAAEARHDLSRFYQRLGFTHSGRTLLYRQL